MRVERRDFIKIAGAGVGMAVAGHVRPGSELAASAASASTHPPGQPAKTSTTLTIDIIGGAALVSTKDDQLVVGTVRTADIINGCHATEHGMVMEVVKGTPVDNSRILHSMRTKKWAMSEVIGQFKLIDADGVMLPDNTDADEIPITPDMKWNDLKYVFQPKRYPKGLALRVRDDWAKRMRCAITIPAGRLTIFPSGHPCMVDGRFEGRNGAKVEFLKPLTSRAQITYTLDTDSLVFERENKETAEPETVTIVAVDNIISLRLEATSLARKPAFRENEVVEHMTMFYELCQTSDGKDIPCNNRILPRYKTTAGQGCPYTGPAPSPGEGCPTAYFVHE